MSTPEPVDLTADLLIAISFTEAMHRGNEATARTLLPRDPAAHGRLLGAFAQLMWSQAEDRAELEPDRFADAHQVFTAMRASITAMGR